MKHYQWDAIQEETLNPHITRKVVHGAGITIARLRLLKGAVIPEHSHHHEQICMVQSGSLKFRIAGGEQVVRAGDALVIAPNEPHFVEALEESHVTDVFSPAREDWISGDDAYLRK